MSLTPSIRKYFSFSSITGVMEPETLQRPYLSIIKNLLKDRFIIQSKDIKLRISDGQTSRAPRVPPDKPFFHCIKTSLRQVARNPLVISRLEDAVLMSNKIVIHALQFIKLYLIDCYDRKIPFPLIDKPFVVAVMKILCQEPSSGRPPSSKTQDLKEELRCFYYAYYEPLKTDNLHYTHMNTVLDYLAIDIITMYENNIKLHFFNMSRDM